MESRYLPTSPLAGSLSVRFANCPSPPGWGSFILKTVKDASQGAAETVNVSACARRSKAD